MTTTVSAPSSLRDRVERALDETDPRCGVAIVGPAPEHRVLAHRDPLPGGGAVLIVLDVLENGESPQPPGRIRADARA